MTTRARPFAKALATKFDGNRSGLKSGMATVLVAAALFTNPGSARAEDEKIIVTHATANFGEPKYGPDFDHLEYANPNAPKGGEFSTWSQGNYDSFNQWTRKGVSATGIDHLYEGMLTSTLDDAYSLYCYLCTTMEYPESKDWVIFNLRDDVTFSDGRPMTAEDVKFTHELFMEQGITEYRNVFSGFIESVEILSSHRIKYTFTEEASRRDVIGIAGGGSVFSKSWFEETETRLDEAADLPFLGTGAYVLESFDVGRQIIYGRNPNYWGADHPFNVGANNFDRMRYEYFADSAAALEAFKSGEYTYRSENTSKDWATAYNFPAVENGQIVLAEPPDGSIGSAQSWVFNLRRETWQDPKVREAVRLMFNFEWSNETLFYQIYDRVNSFWENSPLEAMGAPTDAEKALLQPLVDDALLDASILTDDAVVAPTSGSRNLDRRNLRRASTLLDEAGWIVGDDGKRRKDGKTLDLVLLGFSPAFDRIINPYLDNLNSLGLNAKLDRVDVSQYIDRRRTGDYDLVNHTFSMGFEPGTGLKQWYASETAEDSSRNLMGLQNSAVDRLVDNVIEAETLEDLTTATHALDRVLRADGFWIPQWFKDKYTIAYYNMYRQHEITPPLGLPVTSHWWIDADAEAKLRADGAF